MSDHTEEPAGETAAGGRHSGELGRLFSVANFRVRIGKEWIGCRSVGPLRMLAAGHEPQRSASGAEAEVGQVLTLRRALTESTLFQDWCRVAADGKPSARDVLIEQLDHVGAPTGIGWVLEGAEPRVWTGPAFDALDGAVSEESIEIGYRSIRRSS